MKENTKQKRCEYDNKCAEENCSEIVQDADDIVVELIEQFSSEYLLPSRLVHVEFAVFGNNHLISLTCEEQIFLLLLQLPATSSTLHCEINKKMTIDKDVLCATEANCMSCFNAVDEVFALSEHNHLVKLIVNWKTCEIRTRLDGHIITNAHRVTMMRRSPSRDASDSLMAMALSNGEVILLCTLTLNKIKIIDTFVSVQHLRSISPIVRCSKECDVTHRTHDAGKNIEKQEMEFSTAIVLHVSVGERYIFAITPDGFLAFDKLSYELNYKHSILFANIIMSSSNNGVSNLQDDVDINARSWESIDNTCKKNAKPSYHNMCSGCSCNGSWFVYLPHKQNLHYHLCRRVHSSRERTNAIIAKIGNNYNNDKTSSNERKYKYNNSVEEYQNESESNDECHIDIIHASAALPSSWMEPLLLSTSQEQEKSRSRLHLPSASRTKVETNKNNNNKRVSTCNNNNNSSSSNNNNSGSGDVAASVAVAFTTGSVDSNTRLPVKTTKALKDANAKMHVKYANKCSSSSNRANNTSRVESKPVTFGHPIKSSGYNCQPWSVQQEQKQNQQARQRAKLKALNSSNNRSISPLRYHGLSPYTAHPLCLPYTLKDNSTSASAIGTIKTRSTHHTSAVTSLCTSASGRCLFAAGADGSVLMCDSNKIIHGQADTNARLSRAHTTPVCCVDCSLSLQTPLVMTSSLDGQITITKPTIRETPYILHQESSKNTIHSAHFYYLDQFITYTCNSRLYVVKYLLDDGGGDLYRNRNESRLASSEPLIDYTVSAQYITAMDCVNHFASNLILMTTSSKEIHIYDVGAQAIQRVIRQAHHRPIHHLVLNKGGRFVLAEKISRVEEETHSLSNTNSHDDDNNTKHDGYNSKVHVNSTSMLAPVNVTSEHLFATAGLDNTVRLWDMRDAKPTRALTFHKNTALSTIGVTFNQTGTLLATGSEDRSIYLYDIRMSGNAPLDVIQCPDIPSALTWHPLQPTLIVGLMSGAIMSFSQL